MEFFVSNIFLCAWCYVLSYPPTSTYLSPLSYANTQIYLAEMLPTTHRAASLSDGAMSYRLKWYLTPWLAMTGPMEMLEYLSYAYLFNNKELKRVNKVHGHRGKVCSCWYVCRNKSFVFIMIWLWRCIIIDNKYSLDRPYASYFQWWGVYVVISVLLPFWKYMCTTCTCKRNKIYHFRQ